MALIDDLVARIEQRAAHTRERVLIGIAGPPGAGKTRLAEHLVRRLAGADDWRGSRVAHVPMDGFHLADTELERRGLLARKGAPDTFDADGYAALLEKIVDGDEVLAPSFDRTFEQPIANALPVLDATQIVVSEGNYLLLGGVWRSAYRFFDEVWFCRLDDAIRRDRLRARRIAHGQAPDVAERWLREVDEPNADLIKATEERADLVIDVD